MNSYPLSFKTLFLGGALAILILGAWEMHWRGQGYPIKPEDNKALWAEHRGKIEKLTSEDVVIIGSSRVLFDFQLDEWEAVSGRRPVMLAAAGTTPMPPLTDIVENSKFKGTLVIGVTPPLYFSPMDPGYMFYERINNWVEYYHKWTPADRFNHHLSKGPQNVFAFLNSTEEGHETELSLKVRLEQLFKTNKPPRVPGPPEWPAFSYMDKDRNVTMFDAVSEDPVYAKRVTDFWSALINMPPEMRPPPEVQEMGRLAAIEYSKSMVEKFKARGGKIIFVRCPSDGPFLGMENGGFPRDKYWDDLLETVGCPGYHFEDYEFMNKYTPPEWSHLATPDARKFTTDFVRQLQADGHL